MPDKADGMLAWVTHNNVDTERIDDQVVVSVPLGEVVFQGTESSAPMTDLPANKEQPIEIEEGMENKKVTAVKQLVYIWSPQSRAESTTMWFLKKFELSYEDTPWDNSRHFMTKEDFDKAVSARYAFAPEPRRQKPMRRTARTAD